MAFWVPLLIGAAMGGGSAAVNGGDAGDILKGALMGGATGGIGSAVAPAIGGLFGGAGAGAGAGAAGATAATVGQEAAKQGFAGILKEAGANALASTAVGTAASAMMPKYGMTQPLQPGQLQNQDLLAWLQQAQKGGLV